LGKKKNLLEPSGPVQACNGIALFTSEVFRLLIHQPMLLCDGNRKEPQTLLHVVSTSEPKFF